MVWVGGNGCNGGTIDGKDGKTVTFTPSENIPNLNNHILFSKSYLVLIV